MKKRLIEVVFIMDRSGSMSGLEADTIGGFNSMLTQQQRGTSDAETNKCGAAAFDAVNDNSSSTEVCAEKKKQSDDAKLETESEVIWSTVLFDHISEVLHDRKKIDEVTPLTEDDYYVRGSTALLDAIGGAIRHIGNVHKYAREEDRPDKTLFVITTDGMENSSRIFRYKDVERMIKRQQEKYGWEFMFLGANMDAVSVAGRMGISADRAARFHNDGIGIAMNYSVVAEVSNDLRRGADAPMKRMDVIREDYENRK